MDLWHFQTPNGPMNMNAAAITNMGTPVNATDAATKAYVDAATGASTGTYSLDTGVANAYVVANPVIAAYAAGDVVCFKVGAGNTSTGPSTIAVNGLAAKSIKKYGSVAIAAGDLVAGQVYEAIYDGTNMELQTPTANTSSAGFAAAAGSGTALTLTLSPALSSYIAGQHITFTVGTTNTGAATINVNGLGAIALKKYGNVALVAGELIAGVVYEAIYDGTNFALLAVTPSQIPPGWCGTAGGGANTLTLTPAPPILAYVAGQKFSFIGGFASTGATTVNVSGLGTKAITKQGATALANGDLLAAGIYDIQYDGTQFQLVQPVVT